MNMSSSETIGEQRPTVASHLFRGTLWLMWQAIRLPVFVFLVILEPVVRIVLGSVALLCMLTAFFFKGYGVPHFPFLLMIATSLGLGLALVGYYALLRVFGR
ncbi:MAG: hypothetical protein ACRETP_01100 [Steroidobacteraceae bacterium]